MTTVKFTNILVGIVSLINKLIINDNVRQNEFKVDCSSDHFYLEESARHAEVKARIEVKLYVTLFVCFMMYYSFRVHVKY